MSHFLISCGGTGGHLSPGIALAEELAARGHTATLLISQKKVDARLIEKYPQMHFARMPGSGFSWHPISLMRCLFSQFRALRFCRRLIRQTTPVSIVGFGGFTSAPIVLAGRWARLPVVLHESNRVPGMAIRWLGRLATLVYLPPGVLLPRLQASCLRHVAPPVRREIVRTSSVEARRVLGLDPMRKVLVLLGGSQGASALNLWAREHVEALAHEGVQLYCVTGLGKGASESLTLKTQIGDPISAIFVPFSDRVAQLLSAADLVVSRAGAGSIAELIRCETPAILVPFPQSADDHQRANAAYFEQQGGGVVIEQVSLAKLSRTVLDLIFNDSLLSKYRAQLKVMNRADSVAVMVNDLERLVSSPASSASISSKPAT
ncbi:MAG: UDP-N-acetylglucosamine--N-acetylmuramyl-(pentapeptide) pyrophosphoryl-undecaprenol N-acetylglucosamine transferase [Opitutaceae bacterium]